MSRALIFLSAAIAMMLAIPPAHAMSDYRWRYRPVIVLAGTGSDAALAEQRRIFAANRAALAERDIVVIWVTGNKVRAELGPGPGPDSRTTSRAIRLRRDRFPRRPRRQGRRHEAHPVGAAQHGHPLWHHQLHAHAPQRGPPPALDKRTRACPFANRRKLNPTLLQREDNAAGMEACSGGRAPQRLVTCRIR